MKISRYREFTSSLLQPGVRLLALRSDRFKTARVRIYLLEPLQAVQATQTALLAGVLRAGTASHPTRRDLARACENLYGAAIGASVTRFADAQALVGYADFPAERFLPKGSKELDGVLGLLCELLTQPALDRSGSAFRADVLQQERQQLEFELKALADEKPSWAAWLASQRVYAGTPGAVHEQGSLDDLPGISAEQLFQRHQSLLRNARVLAFVTGPLDEKRGLAALARHLRLPASARPALPLPGLLPHRQRPVRDVVKDSTEQTHLIAAYTGGARYGDADYAAALFADGIFGGFSFSRLFKVVREEHGLAYAVGSHYQRARGVIMAQAAVDPAKADKAAALIQSELKRLAKDGFSSDEFEACRASLVESRQSAWDSPTSRASDAVFQAVLGFKQAPEAQLKAIRAVKPAAVRAALKALRLHTEFRYGT